MDNLDGFEKRHWYLDGRLFLGFCRALVWVRCALLLRAVRGRRVRSLCDTSWETWEINLSDALDSRVPSFHEAVSAAWTLPKTELDGDC